jgi:hypothetical protein
MAMRVTANSTPMAEVVGSGLEVTIMVSRWPLLRSE